MPESVQTKKWTGKKKQKSQVEDDVWSLLGKKNRQCSSSDDSSTSSRSPSASSTSSDKSGFSLASRDSTRCKKKKKHHEHKSGIHEKSSKWVKPPQIYPRARLDNQYVMQETTSYKELTFGQFVAGELEILKG